METVVETKSAQPPTPDSFPWKPLWKPKMPPKVSLYIWTAALGKILMIYNLWKRWVMVIDQCCMCKKDGEMINHLFIHCPVARELWNLIISLFGV